jgi:Mg2+/Co2+ transporter CorB
MSQLTALIASNLAGISSLLILWGVLTLVIFAFATIVHSASAYSSRKRFWRMFLLTLGVVYVLSALLTLFLHVSAILVAMISLLAAFVIQGDIGIHRNDVTVVAEIKEAEEQEEPQEIMENEIIQ